MKQIPNQKKSLSQRGGAVCGQNVGGSCASAQELWIASQLRVKFCYNFDRFYKQIEISVKKYIELLQFYIFPVTVLYMCFLEM